MAKKAATKKQPTVRRDSPRERLFVAEYLKDLNATQAAVRAGYSPKTARQIGSRLLSNVDIAKAIAAAVAKREDQALSDAEWLRKRLRAEAEADIGDLYNDDGSLKPVREWPAIWRQGLVTGLEVVSIATEDDDATDEREAQAHGGALKRSRKPNAVLTKIKWADKSRIKELLGRHVDVQAWKDRKVVSADEPLRQLFEQIAGQSIRPKDSSR
ncbi:terminase small subunit [Aminobacter sp. MDW-2]|uniref:terminase small subunit n=1 Tax=Aminobacter sp. MDW-2 TaxID=2666139 RepID=UPI0012B0CFAF|nr:terminase small subunit [Aminobacter sp. MDW-2]MRX32820.1 terminase small subunit [Aminobacter sp. MDW-2]QNH34521.1 terminase small subunit [Aminobacter sp. MDW-2]